MSKKRQKVGAINWCGLCLARLISYIQLITQMITDNIVNVGITTQRIVDWVNSKTQILLETLRTRNHLRVEIYVSLEVEHSYPWVGCARKQTSVSHSFYRIWSSFVGCWFEKGRTFCSLDSWDLVMEVLHSCEEHRHIHPTSSAEKPLANFRSPSFSKKM